EARGEDQEDQDREVLDDPVVDGKDGGHPAPSGGKGRPLVRAPPGPPRPCGLRIERPNRRLVYLFAPALASPGHVRYNLFINSMLWQTIGGRIPLNKYLHSAFLSGWLR